MRPVLGTKLADVEPILRSRRDPVPLADQPLASRLLKSSRAALARET